MTDDTFDAAKQVAGNLTPHGNRRQLPKFAMWLATATGPRKTRDFGGIKKLA
jgi:hypothetical protein